MDDGSAGFEWDAGNLAHCGRHGVSRAEIEGLFGRPILVLPDPGHSLTERRLRGIGRGREGRPMFVVFTIRERDGRRMIRPISARYMHGKEIDRYEEDNPGL